MVKHFKNISELKKELEKFKTLREKIEFLEKLLKEIKDKNLRKEVEALLDSLKEQEKQQTLESKIQEKLGSYKELVSEKEPFEEAQVKKTLEALKKYEKKYEQESRPVEKAEKETPLHIVYKLRLQYIPETSRETIREVLIKYIREKHIRPEEIAASPQLRHTAAEEAYELLGKTVNLYEIEKQMFYEGEKLAHPDLEWERDPSGWIKYKPLKGEKPKIVEEG